MLTPLSQSAVTPQEKKYERLHKRVRCLIEQCNGLLKNRFRCLLQDRVLHYAPVYVSKIILSCVVLHNLCLEHNIPLPEDEGLTEESVNLARIDREELTRVHNSECKLGQTQRRRALCNLI